MLGLRYLVDMVETAPLGRMSTGRMSVVYRHNANVL